MLATELDYFALPKNDRGGLDVTSAEITIVADSGDIAPGASATVTADLTPGSYVLADPGDPFVTVGMRAPLTVEAARRRKGNRRASPSRWARRPRPPVPPA